MAVDSGNVSAWKGKRLFDIYVEGKQLIEWYKHTVCRLSEPHFSTLFLFRFFHCVICLQGEIKVSIL
jgi:hypothetical protein